MDESDGRYICILAHVGKTTLADHLWSKQRASPEASCEVQQLSKVYTHAVLRQAWIEKLTPLSGCLMLTLYPSGEITDESLELLEDDEEVTFQPRKGNVCALDGWGFGVSELANFYAFKLGAKADGVLGSNFTSSSVQQPQDLGKLWSFFHEVVDVTKGPPTIPNSQLEKVAKKTRTGSDAKKRYLFPSATEKHGTEILLVATTRLILIYSYGPELRRERQQVCGFSSP
ncbi:hypothetical protein Bca4012_094844 [Brassica carinata]